MIRWVAAAAATLVVAPVAGLDGPRVALGQAPPSPAPARSEEVLLQLADEIAKEIEGLRGWSFAQPVRKQVATPEGIRKYVEQQIDEELPGRKLPVTQAFLRTLGLLPARADLRQTYLAILENQVGGLYDPATKTMLLVRRPDAVPALAERLVLVHELTHALDDQKADLHAFRRARSGASEDASLAASSVVEGSATGLMLQYLARGQLSGRFELADLQQYAAQELERSKPFLEAPRYFTTMLATYVCGSMFLSQGDLAALALSPDNKALGEAFLAAIRNPPRSTEQILHPKKYWDPVLLDEPVLVDDGAAAAWLTAAGRRVVHRDTVGEMLTAILTTPKDSSFDPLRMQTPAAWTTPGASGWGGDRFYLLASGSTDREAEAELRGVAGVWVTLWDTETDRDEFLATLGQGPMPAARRVVRVGASGAVVFLGFGGGEAEALAARLEQSPLPMTKSGKHWSPGGHLTGMERAPGGPQRYQRQAFD